MQPKRPISRSSTPIDFTPLILDLDSEVKQEPKRIHGPHAIRLVVIGAAVLFLVCSYFAFKMSLTDRDSKTITHDKSIAGIVDAQPDVSGIGIEQERKEPVLRHGVTNVKLEIENTNGEDVLKIVFNDKAEEGVIWKYQWTNNNQPCGHGESFKGFKRGDNVAVTIVPFDGKKYGEPKTLTTVISNTTPRILEEKAAISSDGKQLVYHVKAADPDGDNLVYALVQGPQGAVIDARSGIISWPTASTDNQSRLDFKVKVSDGHGGEVVHPFTVNFLEVGTEKLTGNS